MNWSMAQSDTKSKQVVENQGESREIKLEGYSAAANVTISGASGTSGYVTASPSPGPPISKTKLRAAVLACIQAALTLGRTEINTQEIANALEISVQEVDDAIEALKKHGVRRR